MHPNVADYGVSTLRVIERVGAIRVKKQRPIRICRKDLKPAFLGYTPKESGKIHSDIDRHLDIDVILHIGKKLVTVFRIA